MIADMLANRSPLCASLGAARRGPRARRRATARELTPERFEDTVLIAAHRIGGSKPHPGMRLFPSESQGHGASRLDDRT